MGIRINLDVMMARRKIGLTELAARVDITMANLSILKNNKARAVRFSTLEALCKALECQPGDILEYVGDTNTAGGESGRSEKSGGNAEMHDKKGRDESRVNRANSVNGAKERC